MSGKKNGAYYLRKKLDAALEENKRLRIDKAELSGTIVNQSARISALTVELANARDNNAIECCRLETTIEDMLDHMGWFRRLLWDIKHANKE